MQFGFSLVMLFFAVMIFGMLSFILLYLININEGINGDKTLPADIRKKKKTKAFYTCWIITIIAALALCALVMFLNQG